MGEWGSGGVGEWGSGDSFGLIVARLLGRAVNGSQGDRVVPTSATACNVRGVAQVPQTGGISVVVMALVATATLL